MGDGPKDSAKKSAAEAAESDGVLASRVAGVSLGREGELAAGVHEVQNALMAVLGWLEVARETSSTEQRDRALQVMERGLLRARSLVGALSRPEERWSVRIRPFRVRPVLQEAYELVQPRCASVGVSLVLDAPEATLRASGDPDRVQQILTNLLLNAVDAVLAVPGRTASRGRVELSVRVDAEGTAEQKRVHLLVKDDGIGMSEPLLERVFEPYFTTHPKEQGARKAGSGLGLAIGRAFAEAMEGSLTARSTPGKGSEFCLSLPQTLAHGINTTSVAPPAEEAGLPAGTRVLVVDDEPAIRELLEVALALRGAIVATAEGTAAARKRLSQEDFDVVMIDETLGIDESGAALVAELRAANAKPAFVLMTGAPSVDHLPGEVSQWLLRKPFSLDEAVHVLTGALSSSAKSA